MQLEHSETNSIPAQVKDIKQQAQRALREAASELQEAESSSADARLQVSNAEKMGLMAHT